MDIPLIIVEAAELASLAGDGGARCQGVREHCSVAPGLDSDGGEQHRMEHNDPVRCERDPD
jgi:hypothetical protein